MGGEIYLDDESGRLFCRPDSKADLPDLMAMIKKWPSRSAIRTEGGEIVIDIATAASLLDRGTASGLRWKGIARSFALAFANGYGRRSVARRRLTSIQLQEVADSALADYEKHSILDDHQRVAVAAMTDPLIDGLCLFDEQGSGKTVMTIHAFDRLADLGHATKLLIFAPKNMLPAWKADFERFMGAKYNVQLVAGDRKSKFAALLSSADVYVTNYETAHTLEASLRALLTRFPEQFVMTVDESFFVKNAAAIRSAAIRRLRPLCGRCWMLCGTPVPNGAIDIVHQFNVADCGVTFASVNLPNDPNELRDTVQNVVEKRGLFLRRLKRDVLPDLPPKSYQRVGVDMEPIQRGLYQETLTGLIEDVVAADERGFHALFASFLARRMALLQIASNPRLVFPDYSEQLPKHTALDVLLERLIERENEKVVLWSYFRGSLDDLERRYSKYGTVRLDGSITSLAARGEAVKKFQDDEATKLFIGNPAAAGAGITLTAGRTAIYESFPTQAAHFLQSIDRIHRRGQELDTYYYFLLSHNTLEEDEYDRLLAKDRMGFELFGDQPPELQSRDVFLRELQDALTRLNESGSK